LRSETVIECERLWRAVPSRWRLGELIIEHPRKGFAISEIRWSAGHNKQPDWQPGAREADIAACLFELRIGKDEHACNYMPLVAVGMHALGRRFERGADRLEDARADLESLVAWAAEDMAADRIRVPSGVWCGGMAETLIDFTRRVRVRHVRTFYLR
jgi:hypothetical protein